MSVDLVCNSMKKLLVNFIILYTIMLSMSADSFLFFFNSYTFYFSCLKARIPVQYWMKTLIIAPYLISNCRGVGVYFKTLVKLRKFVFFLFFFFIPSCKDFFVLKGHLIPSTAFSGCIKVIYFSLLIGSIITLIDSNIICPCIPQIKSHWSWNCNTFYAGLGLICC